MRIIDKNTDFYDFYQNIYRDYSITFDRTDSFLLTKEIMCQHLHRARPNSRFFKEQPYSFALLQVCHTFWLFLVEITKETEYGCPSEYTIDLITTWKNYDKPRRLIKLDIISFGYHIDRLLCHDRYWMQYDKTKILSRADTLSQAIDSNDYDTKDSINRHTIYKGGAKYSYQDRQIEKHIPLLKACGIGSLVDPLEIFLAFEEYFSLEKSSTERTASIGITDEEKAGNHGFDAKTSFRGKIKP